MLDQPTDDKAVVDAVAIGCDHVVEGERAVAVVALPEDIQIVVDDAVAAYLVSKDERHIADTVGEEAVEEPPWQLAGDYGVV